MKAKVLRIATAILLTTACAGDVSGPGTSRVDRVEVTAPATTLDVGGTLQLTATPKDGDGRPLAGVGVAWASSDEAVATVSAAGLVTARAAGAVVVTATSGGRSRQTALTVRAAAPTVAWVQVTPAGDLILAEGNRMQLGVVARAQDGTEVPGRAVGWSVADTSVAVVGADGVLRARGAGATTVTATVDGRTATSRVFVPTQVQSVELSRAAFVLGVGDLEQVVAVARAANGAVLDRAFTWSTGNPAVATVDASGRVTGRGDGTATITATSEGRSATVRVTVGTWHARTLVAVGDSALPGTLLVKTVVQDGVARSARFVATGGSLRTLGASGRYELAVRGWLRPEGGTPVAAVLTSEGTFMYDVFGGDLVLHPDGGHPAFRGSHEDDGRLVVTWSPEPGAAAATLVFSRP